MIGTADFGIDPETGVIRTTKPLDRETTAEYHLVITASDHGTPVQNTSTTMIVEVKDVNDNTPLFEQDVYNITLSEDTQRGTQIMMLKAHDKDENQKISYRIEHADREIVSLLDMGEQGAILTLSGRLHPTDDLIRIEVSATDQGGLQSHAVVNLLVEDINSAPYFVEHPFSVHVPEDSPEGFPVITMRAIDEDRGANAEVKYWLASGDDGHFRIDTQNGQITVVKELVRENRASYTLVIGATDGAVEPLNATTQLEVIIDDVLSCKAVVVMVGYNPESVNNIELTSAEYSEAGLASGIATRMIVQPLDVIKIRFQLQEEPIGGTLRSGKYNSMIQCIRLMTHEEGMRAFWKGHVPAQGLSAMYGLVQFSSFEWLSEEVGHRISSVNSTFIRSSSDFFCGGIAGCLAMTAAMPLDVIRTRLVAQGKTGATYTGVCHAFTHMWKTEGFRGFFYGWSPSVLQIAPFTGIQFALYNVCADLFDKLSPRHESIRALLCGAVSGTIAKTVLYPLDIVRHRVQMTGFSRNGFGQASSYEKGVLYTIRHIVRNETAWGLFKGLWPSQIKVAASSGCSFLFYDLFCRLLIISKSNTILSS